VVGTAEELPFDTGSFDRVLLSLVLHQLAVPVDALSEAFRVLREAGLVLVRTIAPEHVTDRVPERYIPVMAEADAARLPRIDVLEQLLERAGFTDIATECHVRNKSLALEEEERALRTEIRSRYSFVTAAELEEALCHMREDAAVRGGNWIDPRPRT
jgi:SAM-dependent methyltransferase